MKVKPIFKFILVFIIIMAIYFAIILNIDFFMISYHEKSQEYINPYYKERNTQSVLYKLQTLKEKYQDITKEDIETIKNSAIIKNIFYNILNIKEAEIETYAQSLIDTNRMKLIKYDYDIIYMLAGSYDIAFSTDGKNIVYDIANETNRSYLHSTYWQAKKITEENRNKIYNEIEEKLEELGITESFNFEPETIYIKYYNETIADWDGEIYVVEDNTNNIKIEFELPTYTITSLQIGFEDL